VQRLGDAVEKCQILNRQHDSHGASLYFPDEPGAARDLP
jgi:hypothetical protein